MITSESTNFQSTPNNDSNKTIFKQHSVNLLHKIQGLHTEIEGNKINKFKSFLTDISNMEINVARSTIEKRQLYESLIEQISQLGRQTEEEQHANVKLQLQIQNKLQAFIKNNDRAFEKLKGERIATQDRLNSLLESKIQALIKKCQSYKAPVIPLQEYKEQLQTLRKQVNTFFKQVEKEQQKVRSQTFRIIEECSNLLKDDESERIEIDALDYMRKIKLQVANRVCKLTEQRTKMEEEVLTVLERVYQVTASEATSTLI